jgi:lysophospholipase L1-like esterase
VLRRVRSARLDCRPDRWQNHPVRYRRFVAVGDSFTEGLDDRLPDGSFRGWADLVAAALAVNRPDFTYANLAVRGRLYDNIATQQVPPALEMQPDLVSFAAGGNDVLRRQCDPYDLMSRFDQTVATLRACGADVVLFRFADVMAHLPGQSLVAPRVKVLNESVMEIAEKHGAALVDLWADDEYRNPALWSTDRLHMSFAGHRRTAAHVLTALGVPVEASWFEAHPRPAPKTWHGKAAADARWAVQHLAPWVKRRLTGRSSGDNVTAKRPALGPVDLAN